MAFLTYINASLILLSDGLELHHMIPLPKQLELRSFGILEPRNFRLRMERNRLTRLSPSTTRNFESTPTASALFDGDLDKDSSSEYLLTSCFDGLLRIYDVASGRIAGAVERDDSDNHRTSTVVQWYPPDNGVFLTSGGKALRVWDANRMKAVESFTLESHTNSHHCSNIGGHQLVAVATDSKKIRLIDLKSGSNAQELGEGPHVDAITQCRWSNRRQHLIATGDKTGKICFWDIRSAKVRLKSLDYNDLLNRKRKRDLAGRAHDGSVLKLRFSENGLELFSLGSDKKLRRWCCNEAKNMKAKFSPFESAPMTLTIGNAFGVILVGCGTFVYVFDAKTEKSLATLEKGHSESVSFCEFNTTSGDVYSGAKDGNIVVWEPAEVPTK